LTSRTASSLNSRVYRARCAVSFLLPIITSPFAELEHQLRSTFSGDKITPRSGSEAA
jgi:hypothetical protein